MQLTHINLQHTSSSSGHTHTRIHKTPTPSDICVHTQPHVPTDNSTSWLFVSPIAPLPLPAIESSNVRLRNPGPNSRSFVTVKNGGLFYGASKPNIACEGITDTSKNMDGEYIRVQSHLPSPPLRLVSLLFFSERTLAVNASRFIYTFFCSV